MASVHGFRAWPQGPSRNDSGVFRTLLYRGNDEEKAQELNARDWITAPFASEARKIHYGQPVACLELFRNQARTSVRKKCEAKIPLQFP